MVQMITELTAMKFRWLREVKVSCDVIFCKSFTLRINDVLQILAYVFVIFQAP